MINKFSLPIKVEWDGTKFTIDADVSIEHRPCSKIQVTDDLLRSCITNVIAESFPFSEQPFSWEGDDVILETTLVPFQRYIGRGITEILSIRIKVLSSSTELILPFVTKSGVKLSSKVQIKYRSKNPITNEQVQEIAHNLTRNLLDSSDFDTKIKNYINGKGKDINADLPSIIWDLFRTRYLFAPYRSDLVVFIASCQVEVVRLDKLFRAFEREQEIEQLQRSARLTHMFGYVGNCLDNLLARRRASQFMLGTQGTHSVFQMARDCRSYIVSKRKQQRFSFWANLVVGMTGTAATLFLASKTETVTPVNAVALIGIINFLFGPLNFSLGLLSFACLANKD